MGHLTTAQIRQTNANRRQAMLKADSQRTSEVARIATELQRQAPGLTRTDALKIAESAIPPTI